MRKEKMVIPKISIRKRIDTLTNIIINMQKSLNFIDYEERAHNIIISGLSEKILLYLVIMIT